MHGTVGNLNMCHEILKCSVYNKQTPTEVLLVRNYVIHNNTISDST